MVPFSRCIATAFFTKELILNSPGLFSFVLVILNSESTQAIIRAVPVIWNILDETNLSKRTIAKACIGIPVNDAKMKFI